MSSESLQSFEDAHYDEYEYYNLADYPANGGGKGRDRRELGQGTSRHRAAGRGRKVAETLYNSELKRKRLRN